MVRLSIWERRALIAPKVDIDNALHLTWCMVMSDPKGYKLEVLEEMQAKQREMLSKNGGRVEDREVRNYVSEILEGFKEVASGRKKKEVTDEAELLLSSLKLDAPAKNNLCLIPQIVGFYYPLRTLTTQKGIFTGEFRHSELDWWKSVALHNFQERDNARPAIKISPECLAWLNNLPVEYRKVLAAVAEYRGDWSRAAESPKLIEEYGKETVDRCSRELKKYAEENGKILSVYAKFMDGNDK